MRCNICEVGWFRVGSGIWYDWQIRGEITGNVSRRWLLCIFYCFIVTFYTPNLLMFSSWDVEKPQRRWNFNFPANRTTPHRSVISAGLISRDKFVRSPLSARLWISILIWQNIYAKYSRINFQIQYIFIYQR